MLGFSFAWKFQGMPLIIIKMLKKFYSLILCILFIFVTPIFAMSEIKTETHESQMGYHRARITAPKAIVYADEILSTPMGYIAIDKVIFVGNPRKQNPDLFPTLIYGRVAYIEGKNFKFEDENVDSYNAKKGISREHNVDIMIAKTDEKLSENNSAYLSIQSFSAGSEFSRFALDVSGTGEDNFVGYSASLLHRQSDGRMIWGLNYEYTGISAGNIDLNFFLLGPAVGLTPFKSNYLFIDLILSVDFSLGANFNITDNYQNEDPPFIWGPQLTSRFVFFPTKKYHPALGLSYRTLNVSNLDKVITKNDQLIPGISSMSGLSITLGLGIEF
jgi:hypothetical protein